MAEPFKNMLNTRIIKGMATHFQAQWSGFDHQGFVSTATKNLNTLGLKERSDQITDAMVQHLPDDFEKAAKIMLGSLGKPLGDDLSAGTVDKHGISGWAVTPMTHYVGLFGLKHFDLSMTLFKEMTKCASSEFGIRFFLAKAPKKTLAELKKWTKDDNQHVRRLVSEGTRPRLPWAAQLPLFIQDPAPVITLLQRLKDDDAEYVRRSVANNLNDIAKDHPDLVADIASTWMKDASPERERLIRHGCRTLIKNGHSKTLKTFGYKPAKLATAHIDILTPKVNFGDALAFSLTIASNAKRPQALIIDYIIHHRKANGSTTPKVFKWRTTELPANTTLTLTKQHAIKKITTRVYYPGKHHVEVMVNGTSVCCADFDLIMP